MSDIIDLIATDKASSEISDAIKDLLYTKSSEKLDALKPNVAGSMFDTGVETEDEVETPEAEVEVEDETTIAPEAGEEENVN